MSIGHNLPLPGQAHHSLSSHFRMLLPKTTVLQISHSGPLLPTSGEQQCLLVKKHGTPTGDIVSQATPLQGVKMQFLRGLEGYSLESSPWYQGMPVKKGKTHSTSSVYHPKAASEATSDSPPTVRPLQVTQVGKTGPFRGPEEMIKAAAWLRQKHPGP